MRQILIILALGCVLKTAGQNLESGEVEAYPIEALQPDTTLHLPALNTLGQAGYIGRYPFSPLGFGGWYDWQLHEGMNLSFGASVFSAFGSKYAPKGAGFAQNISGMYAAALTPRLSLAAGAYLVNANWGGLNLRDAGVTAVLGYQLNEQWEAYLYGQKSLMERKMPWQHFDPMEAGDRIGAAIRYNFSPQFSIQVNVESRSH